MTWWRVAAHQPTEKSLLKVGGCPTLRAAQQHPSTPPQSARKEARRPAGGGRRSRPWTGMQPAAATRCATPERPSRASLCSSSRGHAHTQAAHRRSMPRELDQHETRGSGTVGSVCLLSANSQEEPTGPVTPEGRLGVRQGWLGTQGDARARAREQQRWVTRDIPLLPTKVREKQKGPRPSSPERDCQPPRSQQAAPRTLQPAPHGRGGFKVCADGERTDDDETFGKRGSKGFCRLWQSARRRSSSWRGASGATNRQQQPSSPPREETARSRARPALLDPTVLRAMSTCAPHAVIMIGACSEARGRAGLRFSLAAQRQRPCEQTTATERPVTHGQPRRCGGRGRRRPP